MKIFCRPQVKSDCFFLSMKTFAVFTKKSHVNEYHFEFSMFSSYMDQSSNYEDIELLVPNTDINHIILTPQNKSNTYL